MLKLERKNWIKTWRRHVRKVLKALGILINGNNGETNANSGNDQFPAKLI